MIIRDARRYSSFLLRTGRSPVDIVEQVLLNCSKPQFIPLIRKYRVIVTFVGRKRAFQHPCAYRLCVSLYNFFQASAAMYQGQKVNFEVQSAHCDGLLASVKTSLASTFKYVTAPNYGTIAPLPCNRRRPELVRVVEDAIVKYYGEEELRKVQEGYVNSCNIKTPDLMAPAVNKLAMRPAQPLQREVAADILFRKLYRTRTDARKTLCFTPAVLAETTKNGSSAAGILPILPSFGVASKVRGKKADMQAAALAVNIRDRIGSGPPRSLPFKPFFKGEVIKKGKAVRGIQNESMANYQVLRLAGDKMKNFKYGSAIGMGSKERSHKSIFYHWYVEYARMTGNSWELFLEFLDRAGAHESDKTGWEASTNITDGLPCTIVDLNTKDYKTPGDRRLYLRAVADVKCPFIYVDRGGFFCRWRVASGTYRTASDNTERHQDMHAWMCAFIKRHGNRIGRDDCDCFVCEEFGGGDEVEELLLEMKRHAFIYGDDYIGVSLGVDNDIRYDNIIDHVFGTITKTEQKSFFGDGGVEFLRKRFMLEGGNIYFYRHHERVLAKLLHGGFMSSAERLGAALISYKYESGYNPTLHSFIDEVYGKLSVDVVQQREVLKEFATKNPMVADLDSCMQFDTVDVKNMQSRVVDELYVALRDRC